jgi:hypothetical protein
LFASVAFQSFQARIGDNHRHKPSVSASEFVGNVSCVCAGVRGGLEGPARARQCHSNIPPLVVMVRGLLSDVIGFSFLGSGRKKGPCLQSASMTVYNGIFAEDSSELITLYCNEAYVGLGDIGSRQ